MTASRPVDIYAELPANRIGRFRYYWRRYGFWHAALVLIARRWWGLWRVAGPLLTSKALRRWKEHPRPRPVLNLGGGGNCMRGTLTLDVDPHADAYLNLLKPLPFPDASADRIFAEEFLEHISLEDGRAFLRECYRILEPNGVLRITTPDPEWFFAHEDCDALNAIFYSHRHKYLYTRERLKQECQAAGFRVYRLSSYRDPQSRLGYLDTHPERFSHSPDISQYIEVEK